MTLDEMADRLIERLRGSVSYDPVASPITAPIRSALARAHAEGKAEAGGECCAPGTKAWAEHKAENTALRLVVLDFLSTHSLSADCAGRGECVCDDAWPLVGLRWGDVQSARRARRSLIPAAPQPAGEGGGKP